MADGFLGGHAEAYRAGLVNRNGIPVSALALQGGNLDWNMFREIPGGGVAVVKYPDAAVDWVSHLVSISYHAALGSQRIDKQIFTGVVTNVVPRKAEGLLELELLDKLCLLRDDSISSSLSFNAGSVVVEEVLELIRSVGETAVLIDASDETLVNVLSFPAGTDKLSIVNELLKTIHYTPLTVTGSGQFQSTKETTVDNSDPVHEFLPGRYAVVSDQVDDERDLFDIPNRVVCIATSDGNEVSLWASAENNDPENPYSIPRRGRVVTRVVEGVEATSQASLQEITDDYLRSSSQVTWRQTIRHLWTDIKLRDNVVGHAGQLCNVVEMSQDLTPGAQTTTVLRRFDNALDWTEVPGL